PQMQPAERLSGRRCRLRRETRTHGRRDVGTASRELKAWNDRGTEVVAGEAFGDFDPL
ncbi:unnamed protein product, partial [Effrenium voratum]